MAKVSAGVALADRNGANRKAHRAVSKAMAMVQASRQNCGRRSEPPAER